jgi:SIR2-like domain
MTALFEDSDWEALVRQIRKGNCTPFLGAGVNKPFLSLGAEVAQTLAVKYGYPLDDAKDLIRVGQYVATVKADPMRPKDDILSLLENEVAKAPAEQVFAPNMPLGILADLPFRVYITTNYDDLLVRALRTRGREPQREICRWNQATQKDKPPNFPEATVERPVVFHLHGADSNRDSIVLTEDDYVTFLVNLKQDIIPPCIRESLASGILFIGYSLQDWNFRVLHQALVSAREVTTQHGSLSVQVPWEKDAQRREAIEQYLERYFGARHIRIYWGYADGFLQDLKGRFTPTAR